jgi:hypothetical protein
MTEDKKPSGPDLSRGVTLAGSRQTIRVEHWVVAER